MASNVTTATASRRREQRRWWLAAGVGAALIAVIMVSMGIPVLGPDGEKVLTADGMTDLLADAQAELGSTEVVGARLYESYAIVDTAVAGSATRTVSYRYAGDFDDVWHHSRRNDGSTALIDLADVDMPAILRLLPGAARRVGLPDGEVSNVDIRFAAPSEVDDSGADGSGTDGSPVPTVFVHVASDYEESGYVQTDLHGTVLRVERAD